MARRLGHGCAREQQFHVAKIERGIEAEVFIGDVAPARDRGAAVDDQRLVVQAAVHATELAEIQQLAQHDVVVPAREGVVDAVLDVRVSVDRVQCEILVHRERVIEQDAHAHTAVGGRQQALQHARAARVRLPQERSPGRSTTRRCR